ncbi:Formate dehydrogenase, nitrate-inducible, iron-sulfur subunit [subsurface metagenome]
MGLSRRDFLKISAGTTGLLLIQPSALALAKESQNTDSVAMLVDVTKCISCWRCYLACKRYNNLPDTSLPDTSKPPALSPQVWTTLKPVMGKTGWISRKHACNHCTNAACVDVCPTGALSYSELGFVQYNKEKCSGCGYCAEFCPFGIPQMEGNRVTGAAVMDKCTFCQDRVINGEQTACAESCPVSAIKFGRRYELVEEGRERVTALLQTNPNALLYGDKQLGGLHVMYVLDDLPEVYGLPADPELPVAATVRDVFKWVGVGAAAAAVAGFGLNYLIARARIAKGEKK